MPPAGFEPAYTSKRVAADTPLRPGGHRAWPFEVINVKNALVFLSNEAWVSVVVKALRY